MEKERKNHNSVSRKFNSKDISEGKEAEWRKRLKQTLEDSEDSSYLIREERKNLKEKTMCWTYSA